ncbi:tyrosine-type recombinase/integrase [Vibrio parahaemolyticus]|uniref:tyrosine-type recombinase/integrase n=1 Tax=Vibrio TaxID=662 RepID=UPI0012996219|nr:MULTISPECIES: tyrosine-type recombinase/integrase [Vibrio]EJU9970010.1 tyrosine-type recombinase/integrase [Vibrio alginolyticus]MBS9958728.1 tyrosine-type recombinase/integrase [Vibrio alginolyticus]MBT0012171.1 tyrosine-type recombinase/integrase [Vibrio alginolyticus]MBT0039894.1 tyrosine-type recombinase/integrase [Vibrio alginolyticus]MCF7509327.1 tyrosine-type recombinase/integrase [Vibrio sp. D54]
METVQAIKDKNVVKKVISFAEKNYSEVVIDVIKVGFNLPLRISDILGLKVDDVDVQRNTVKFKASKTGKSDTFQMTDTLQKLLKKRVDVAKGKGHTFLFTSDSNRSGGADKPISRQQIAKVLQEVSLIVGVHIGTHSFRKTWGYNYYNLTGDIAMVQRILQHRSSSETLRYIGIEQEDINNALKLVEIY